MKDYLEAAEGIASCLKSVLYDKESKRLYRSSRNGVPSKVCIYRKCQTNLGHQYVSYSNVPRTKFPWNKFPLKIHEQQSFGMSEDYAYTISGLLDLFEVSQKS